MNLVCASGADGGLVSPAVFKTVTTAVQAVGWVRFPDAPANLPALRRLVRPTLAGMILILLVRGVALAQAEPVEPERAEDVGQAEPKREFVSPAGAMLRSVIIPGWGQVAARQPARGAIYFTVWSAGLYMIVKTNSEVSSADRGGDEDLADSKKGTREDWIVLTGLWALFSGVDAWVSAQFAGFEGEVRPPSDGSPGVEFSYPLNIF